MRNLTLIALAISTALSTQAIAEQNVKQPSSTQAQQQHQLAITEGRLGNALVRLSAITGNTISVDATLIQNMKSPAIKGSFSTQQAINKFIADLPLQLKITQSNSFTLIAKPVKQQQENVLATAQVTDSTSSNITEGSHSYTTGASNTALGFNISLRDTPQSISVITQERMDDQLMVTVEDALRSTTGVSVKATDRGRNELTSRGFKITNFQLDGIPVASGNIGLETASIAIYDRIDVVRGATGLLNGTGNPAATVNLVRKHANSRELTANIQVDVGSWNKLGATFDVSTPLSVDGDIRSRFVVSYHQQDAFIDLENTGNLVLYGVLDADLTENTTLSVGASYEKNERNGIYWGGLPFWYSDGSDADWSRSKTTATTWNQWDTEEVSLFATLEHQLANDWLISANASYHQQDERSNLLWVTGQPDKVTGLGMSAYPYLYETNPDQYEVSIMASGPIQLFGYQHEISLGVLHSEKNNGWDNGGTPLSEVPPVGNFFNWDGSYPEPVWDDVIVSSRSKVTQTAMHASARLQITDTLKVIIGGRVTNWKRNDEALVWSSLLEIKHDAVVTPFVGVTYDLSENISAYASYSSIFEPQTSQDKNGDYLDPLEGNTYEAGLKGDFFDGALQASAAVYQIRQDNYAQRDGDNLVPGTITPAYYGVDGIESDGYEIEVTGQPIVGWNISLGWSKFDATSPTGADVVERHPRKMLKLFTKYNMNDYVSGLSIGAGFNWQGDEPKESTNPGLGTEVVVGQTSYSLLELMAKYEISQQLSVQLNINNVLDKKYQEISWNTFTSGEPRSVLLSANYNF